jgi:CotH kinase protein/Lamin Tail Domain
MARYYIVASDASGQSTRAPAFTEPTRSPQYFGTVILDPSLTNSRLPALHWFIQNPTGADSDATARCSFFFDGEFYDNVGANIHGQSTRSFPKKSYDLTFNPGDKFRWSAGAPRVSDLNLLTTWADKTYMRNVLAYETYRDGGAPSHFAFAVRVQRNAAFFSVANVVENGGGDFLERLGLDRHGALYKMYNLAESVALAEKKTRRDEGTADLQALINGMSQAAAATRQMFLRRLRTLMDQLLQPPDTDPARDFYRLKTLDLRDQIAPDAALDLAKWGAWGTRETITQAVTRIHNEFLPGRRVYLFHTLSVTNRGGQIPLPEPADAVVQINDLEFRPASGNPVEEWLSLTNANSYAVDLSGWRLDGGVRFQFKPGTVIPSYSALFVSPEVKAFRRRAVSPKGGERRFVVGRYSGNLSAWGETVTLADSSGRLVSSYSFAGDPSPAQRYLRITELFYNPDPLPAYPDLDPQQFEFIELRNTGPQALALRGVRFTKGVQFDFTAGAITNLNPGPRVLAVSDTNAFALRYGTGLPVAGQYIGSLDNAGERLRLEDAFGEPILDFSYDNHWSRTTDGYGYSLTIRDDTLPWSSWASAESWQASSVPGGAPGRPDEGSPPAALNHLTLELAPGGRRLRYFGEPGRACQIQRSYDLVRWELLVETAIPAGGVVEYIDPRTSDRAAYYRALYW